MELSAYAEQIDEDNMLHWNLALMVLNPDSLYYGGYFKAQMNFPKEYPYKPPGQYIATLPSTHPDLLQTSAL